MMQSGLYLPSSIDVETIEKASGRKAFSAQTAASEALQKYGARKLALATPFPDDVNAMVKEYLEKSGFEILSIRGSGGGPVAGLVGIEGGVVSGVFNLESPGVRAPGRRPRHDQRYHEA